MPFSGQKTDMQRDKFKCNTIINSGLQEAASQAGCIDLEVCNHSLSALLVLLCEFTPSIICQSNQNQCFNFSQLFYFPSQFLFFLKPFVFCPS